MRHLNFKNRTMMTLAFMGVASSCLVISCAQKREAKLTDEASRTIFSRTLFDNKDVDVELVNAESENRGSNFQKKDLTPTKNQIFAVNADSAPNKVTSTNVDSKIQFMFRNLISENFSSAKKTKISFRVTKDYITGFVVSAINSDLPLSLRSISLISGSEILTPIFKYKVESYGQLKPKKNELGQDTSTLDIVPCDWSEATHVKLTPTADARLLVESPFGAGLDKPLYAYEKIAAKSFTLSQLKDLFGIDASQLKTSQVDSEVALKLTGEETLSLITNNQVIGTFSVKCSKADISLAEGEDFEPKIALVDSRCDMIRLNDNLLQIAPGSVVQSVAPAEPPVSVEHSETVK